MGRGLWIGLGVAGAGALLLIGRKQIEEAGGILIDQAKRLAFYASIPARARPYADAILAAAKAEGVSPFLLVFLMERETMSGTAPGYSPKGPGGVGDQGHGHGLFQIDDGSHAAWLATHAWADPATSAIKAAQILKSDRMVLSTRAPLRVSVASGATVTISDGSKVTLGPKAAAARGVQAGDYPDPRPLTGDLLDRAVLAAYNTGAGNVLRSVAAGLNPDATTTGGDYGNDVAGRVAVATREFAAKTGAVT